MDLAYGARGVPTALATNVTLTTSYVDSSVIQTAGESKAVLYIRYLQGTAETDNTLIYQLKFSPDNTTWYTEADSPVTTGAATVDKVEHTYTADTIPATDSDYLRIPVDLCDQYFKVSFKEGGVAANAGKVWISIQLGTS